MGMGLHALCKKNRVTHQNQNEATMKMKIARALRHLQSSQRYTVYTTIRGIRAFTGSTGVNVNRNALVGTAVFFTSLGFIAGRQSIPDDSTKVLPNGLPRTCCEIDELLSDLTPSQISLPSKLAAICGAENVIDGQTLSTQTLPFLRGARLGLGNALCIVTPRNLGDIPIIVQAIVDADCVIVVQGQNTGLTGGSVPRPTNDPKRPTVLLSMKYLDRMFPIDDGKRVVCLAGVGLAKLQQFLDTYFPDREPHSVLGSTFLNPTTAAGVAFGSGGTQLRKGPAYTERSLYIRVTTNKWKENIVEVVNTLGVKGLQDRDLPPERARKMDGVPYRLDIWSRWMTEGFDRSMRYSLADDPNSKKPASDASYGERLCIHDSEVSRCNADTRGPEPCRSEGKVIILATVHDTFPKPKTTKMFWLGFDSLETALAFRKEVALDNPNDLPVSMEYLDRDAFDVIDEAGRLMGTCIKYLGTSSPILRQMWNAKLWVESLPFAGAHEVIDRLTYAMNPLFPALLPGDIMATGRRLDHHVSLKVDEYGDGNMDRLLGRLQQFASKHGPERIVVHECNDPTSLNAFRFVAAPAFRTWCIGNNRQGVSVDYALPKNGGEAPVITGAEAKPVKRMRYSHFGCNVVHEDLAYELDVDIHTAKLLFKETVEGKGGKLPAEHGHGTEYKAPKETQMRWKKMDPLNVLNPGVGGLPEGRQYKS
jgi:D-lactate dehydrogenase